MAGSILHLKDVIAKLDFQDRFDARLIKVQLDLYYRRSLLLRGTAKNPVTYQDDKIREICLKILDLCIKDI